MAGDNPPLIRLIDGQRDWDINLDGLAHYGMLPDFLQDLRNQQVDVSPLMQSAEAFAQAWEKAVRVSGR